MGSKRFRNKALGALAALALLGPGCPRPGPVVVGGAGPRRPEAPLRVHREGRTLTVRGDSLVDDRGAVLARVAPDGLVAPDGGLRVRIHPGSRWTVDGVGAPTEGPDGGLTDDHGRTLTLGADGMVRMRTISGREAVAPVRVEGLGPGNRALALALVLYALREERLGIPVTDAGVEAGADAGGDAQRPGR